MSRWLESAGGSLENGSEMIVGWLGKWLGLIGSAVFDGLYFFLLRRPRLLRIAAGALRRWWPILQLPGLTFATRMDDVREVLERDDDFLLSPINERKILSGDFIISLDPSPQYGREKNQIHDAFPPDRIAQLHRIVTKAARRQLPNRVTRGKLNVVEFAERVTVQVVKSFWGLETAAARSKVVCAKPGDETMRLWLRKLAAVIGSREPAPFGVKEVGLACGEEFVRYVRKACEAHANGKTRSSGVLGRIVDKDPYSDATRRNVAGLIVTGTAVVTKAFTHAFEQLLLDERALELAVAAAKARRREEVCRLMIEALRFNTVFPMLARYSPRNTTLARRTPREVEIPSGSVVAVSPTGAMFDPEVVDDPERFGYSRAVDFNPQWRTGSGQGGAAASRGDIYMHFGGGAHWCPGDQMAAADMTAMAMVLLRCLPNPQLVDWPFGLPIGLRRLRYDGPAVASLKVKYG